MTPDRAEGRAVDLLQDLGFREYEARCYVGLAAITRGTATEVSEAAGVPRTRVYDALDGLADRGLVEKSGTDPLVYRAAPVPQAVAYLRQNFERKLDSLRAALDRQVGANGDHEPPAVWSVFDPADVPDRAASLAADATDSALLLLWDDDLLTDPVLDALGPVARRAALLVGVSDRSVRERIEAAAPAARIEPLGAPGSAVLAALLVDDRAAIVVADAGEAHTVVVRAAFRDDHLGTATREFFVREGFGDVDQWP